MATKNVLLFRTKFDSIDIWFLRELLYKNMIWLLGSLQLILYNYVACLFGMIINFFARFQVGEDGKAERCCENEGFREALANFLFQSHEDIFEDFGIGEEKSQSSSLMEAISDAGEEKEKIEAGTLLMEVHSEFQENKKEGDTQSSISMEGCSDNHEDKNKSEGETDGCVPTEVHSDSLEKMEKRTETATDSFVPEVHFYGTEKFVSKELQFDHPDDGDKEGTKSECSISMNVHRDLPGSGEEGESESLVSMGAHSDSHGNEGKEEAKTSVSMEAQSHLKGEGERSCALMEANSSTTAQKYQYVSGRDIRGFMEEATSMRLTFQGFLVGPNVPASFDNNAEIIAQKQDSSENPKEEEDDDDKAESTQENEFLGCNNSQKGTESVSLMTARDERTEESGKDRSNQEKENKHRENAEEWRKMMEELEYEVGNEWRMEWEHDDMVEQLKIELENARQGGLCTILEEQEEEEEDEEELEGKEEQEEGETGETERSEEGGDQKRQNDEENEELNDLTDEIEEVYQVYEEKMRKLDILNYQTMHGLGLLQLKDSAKSSFKGLKPLNRKEPKTPHMKLVEELQRDLEVVYVGQICLSWEILRWLHKKALQLKQHYHSQADSLHHHHPQFNVAAGEFQLFQVLLQRFIENEAFQGPRTLNFVKNRCVIRNLLQVPAIRDDSSKETIINKEDEEYVVSIARLAEIIKESMWLFWRFVRADKDGNLILRISQQTRTYPKDPAISDLVKDIRSHLHKKEKKLKDLVRTGNCIVRKFQKHQQQQEDQLNHEQLLAQVELKLVSRVLNLSKLRKEHLIWCNEKLRRIKFVMKKKKIVMEPSFLPFPC
ncbi:uncharacterized protein LOC114754111 isoform X2 [Neltuma alba]|uniref:uncharacterized protein LOC114754111 isoform X2 n=1 Tax=Neltuma alba TaxID=207710 RepID=UPI0010A32756|nr:uncharacterized protein LOC114754111 isoform X2 [Prosopis alba]